MLAKHRAGEATGLIANYLVQPDESKRIDCTTEQSIERSVTPGRMPDGRWPSTHPLTLMQQVAVNEAFASLGRAGGLFSVNGPPGTGKTTLLMDVVAGILVERAKILCSFDDPSAAFRKLCEVQYQGMSRPTTIFALDERLHGFSIVVASSNNGAVENITRELPNVIKLDKRYCDADYFKPLATVLTNSTSAIEEGEDEEDAAEPIAAWGLISVPLGNKKNRNLFVNTLKAKEKSPPNDKTGVRREAAHNIFRLLQEAKVGANWKRACDEFRAALAEVERIKAEIAGVANIQAKAARLHEAAEAAERAASEARERLATPKSLESRAKTDVDEKRQQLKHADDELTNLREARPGFFARLFHTASFRAWQASWLEAMRSKRNAEAIWPPVRPRIAISHRRSSIFRSA